MKRNTLWKRGASAAAIGLLTLAIVPGCGTDDDDSLGEKAEEATEEVGDTIGDAADDVQDAAEDAVDEAGDKIEIESES